MKRLFHNIVLILLSIILLSASAFAAGTVSQTPPIALFDPNGRFNNFVDPKYVVVVTLTADASAATYPTFQINGTCSSAAPTASPSCTVPNVLLGWYLFKVESYAGSVAPTNGWTATVKDSYGAGYDYCAAKIVGSNSTTPVVKDCYPSGQSYMPVNGPLTVAVTGNVVNSAIITMIFYFLPR